MRRGTAGQPSRKFVSRRIDSLETSVPCTKDSLCYLAPWRADAPAERFHAVGSTVRKNRSSILTRPLVLKS